MPLGPSHGLLGGRKKEAWDSNQSFLLKGEVIAGVLFCFVMGFPSLNQKLVSLHLMLLTGGGGRKRGMARVGRDIKSPFSGVLDERSTSPTLGSAAA